MIRAIGIVVLLARVAAADDLRSSGPLAIGAPGDAVLGRDRELAIRLGGDATRLLGPGGELAIVRGGDGGRATLVLPRERFPQLAIVAALDTQAAVVDWLAIPLAGQARVKVETVRNADVTVRVAGTDQPAVRADRRGVAWIPIIVPPGVSEATAIAIAPSGNRTEKALPLTVPSFARTLLVCHDGRATVIGVAPDGRPAMTAPRVTASTGTVAPLVARGPGLWVTDVVFAAARTTLRAAFADEPAATCELGRAPLPPREVRIRASASRVAAGDDAVELHGELVFAGEAPPAPVEVAFVADLGAITNARGEAASWSASWTPPTVLGARRAARIRLTATWPGGTREAVVSIAVAPAAAATIQIEAPPRLDADGASEARLTARVVDRFGNPTATPPVARAAGAVGAFDGGPDGSFHATYVAPRSRRATRDVVTVVDPTSGRSASIAVPLRPLPRRVALGLHAGVISNLGTLTAPRVTATVDVRLPVHRDRVSLGVEVGAYRGGMAAMTAGGEAVEATITVAPVLARVAVHQPLAAFDLWAGAGAGVAITASEVEAAAAGVHRATAVRPAAAAHVGASYPLLGGAVTLEAAYLHATLADGPVVGRAGGVTASLGFSRGL